jgi:peptidoglycan hydrolase-like protein with peptidoglycan-binding domain
VSQGHRASIDEEEIISLLRRLRLGSSGEAVKLLQQKLGLAVTGYFGAETQQELFAWQKREGRKPDAIYSPDTELATGWGIL